jgi:hypothetical protein
LIIRFWRGDLNFDMSLLDKQREGKLGYFLLGKLERRGDLGYSLFNYSV